MAVFFHLLECVIKLLVPVHTQGFLHSDGTHATGLYGWKTFIQQFTAVLPSAVGRFKAAPLPLSLKVPVIHVWFTFMSCGVSFIYST